MEMKEGTLCLGVSLCRYQLHPKPSPWDKFPGHDLKGTKTLPLGTIILYKNPPLGTKQGVKSSHPWDIKPKNFTNVCIYKLFEMN